MTAARWHWWTDCAGIIHRWFGVLRRTAVRVAENCTRVAGHVLPVLPTLVLAALPAALPDAPVGASYGGYQADSGYGAGYGALGGTGGYGGYGGGQDGYGFVALAAGLVRDDRSANRLPRGDVPGDLVVAERHVLPSAEYTNVAGQTLAVEDTFPPASPGVPVLVVGEGARPTEVPEPGNVMALTWAALLIAVAWLRRRRRL